MPFKSKAQQRYLFAKHPAVAKRWAEHTEDFESLPERSGGKEASVSTVKSLAFAAAGRVAQSAAEKLAADSGLLASEVADMSAAVGIPLASFCKQAYEDPEAFNALAYTIKQAISPQAGGESQLMTRAAARQMEAEAKREAERLARRKAQVLDLKRELAANKAKAAPAAVPPAAPVTPPGVPAAPAATTGASTIMDRLRGAASSAGQKYHGVTESVGGHVGGLINRMGGKLGPKGMGRIGKALVPAAAGAGLLGTGALASSMMGSSQPESPGAVSAPEVATKNMPAAVKPPVSAASSLASSVSPTMKGLAAAGGLAAGGYGLSKLIGGRKKRKEAMDKVALGTDIMLGAMGMGGQPKPQQPQQGGFSRLGQAAQSASTQMGPPGQAQASMQNAWNSRQPQPQPQPRGVGGLGGMIGNAVGGMGRAVRGAFGKSGASSAGNALTGLLTKNGGNLALNRALGDLLADRMRKKGNDDGLVKRAMLRAVMTKLAAVRRQESRVYFTHYLDKVASYLPVDRQYSLRLLQASISGGEPLSRAIKVAFPQLGGEQRGLLAAKLVKAASAFKNKRANSGSCSVPTQEPITQSGPVGDMKSMMGKAGL